MKTMFKKIVSVTLAVVLLLATAPVSGLVGLDLPSFFGFKAEAAAYSGTCGDNLTWSLDTSTGVLEISGKGEMTEAPWKTYGQYIKSVNISNDVTFVIAEAFKGCYNLETLKFPIVNSVGGSLYYGKSASKITIANGEVIVEWTEGDPITQLEFGEDFTNFELFNAISGACGLVESIVLDEANTEFKLIDGVLYDKDVTTLLIYPTGSDKSEYIMPDTVTKEYDYYYHGIVQTTALTSAVNLKSLTLGASFGEEKAKELIDKYTVLLQDSTTKGEEMYNLLRMSQEASEDFFGAYGTYLSSNRPNEFYVSADNKYLKHNNGMLILPIKGYDVFVKCMVNHIDRYELDGNDVVGYGYYYILSFVEIDELVISDEFAESQYLMVDYYYTKNDREKNNKKMLLDAAEVFGLSAVKAKSFVVEKTNKYFSVVDGVLYSKDGKGLLAYPMGSDRAVFVCPPVEYVAEYAFSMVGEAGAVRKDNFVIHVSDPKTLENFSLYVHWAAEICCTEEIESYYGYTLEDFNSFVDRYNENNAYYIIDEIKNTSDEMNEYTYDTLMNFYTKQIKMSLSYLKICSGHETEHKHTPKIITVPASCTVNGIEYVICKECGDTIGDPIVIPAGHTPGEWQVTEPATCKKTGVKVKVCTACGETLENQEIPMLSHVPGEWETELEATTEHDGRKVQRCAVCGEILDEEIIPMIVISKVVDEESGVELEFVKGDYDGEVNITVEPVFDGSAFQLVNTLNVSQLLFYDITMTVNGVVTQPSGKVTVKIPLPEDFEPTRSFVYHVNSTNVTVEKMAAKYVDGFMVFETDHFSYYVIVQEFDAEIKINAPSTTVVNYGETLVLSIGEIELPEGYTVEWVVEGSGFDMTVSEDGKECRLTSTVNGTATVTAKIVNAEGEAVTDADGTEFSSSITLTSKAGFFQKFISFFKNLFRINRVIY